MKIYKNDFTGREDKSDKIVLWMIEEEMTQRHLTSSWCHHSINSLWPSDATWVNIGSGNGLLPDGTKPLPEPMLSYHQRCSVAFTCEQFQKRCSWTWSVTSVCRLYFLNYCHISQKVNSASEISWRNNDTTITLCACWVHTGRCRWFHQWHPWHAYQCYMLKRDSYFLLILIESSLWNQFYWYNSQ